MTCAAGIITGSTANSRESILGLSRNMLLPRKRWITAELSDSCFKINHDEDALLVRRPCTSDNPTAG